VNPSIILKNNQILFTLMPRDYAFINEGHIHRILGILYQRHLRSHLMQASAIQFSFCTDEAEGLEENIQKALSEDFLIRYNQGLQLITLRHYQEESWQSHFPGWEVLLEQRSRTTIQALLRKRE
jgi:aspartate kinase